jgi:hypothetical protein
MSTMRRDELLRALRDAARAVLGDDLNRMRGFARAQLDALAQQALYIGAGVADGTIDEPMQGYFLDALREMTRSFVNTLIGLAEIAVERLYNALLDVLWQALGAIAGVRWRHP